MKASTVGNLNGEVLALLFLKRTRCGYYGRVLLLLVIAAFLGIRGLNLTARRMSAMAPQLPGQVLAVKLSEGSLSVDILGSPFQIPLPLIGK